VHALGQAWPSRCGSGAINEGCTPSALTPEQLLADTVALKNHLRADASSQPGADDRRTGQGRPGFPFPMLGVDSENDSVFITKDIFDYSVAHRFVQARSRAYKKNDQAWVGQKNGAIVSRLVGYGRMSGTEATKTLAASR